jgi:hypothetical protein
MLLTASESAPYFVYKFFTMKSVMHRTAGGSAVRQREEVVASSTRLVRPTPDTALRVAVTAGEAMRRISLITVGPLLALALLAGCSESAVSPIEAPAIAAPAPVSLAPAERPALQLNGALPDSAAADFVVGPWGGVFFAGNHAVVFPSQSICDPATSGYGPDKWDAPCTPLQTPLRVHAEVRRREGKTWVDFTPSVRFVPSANPSRWVWVAMYTPEASGATGDLSRFNILWASQIGGTTVDETSVDPSMRTYVDTWSGVSMRRIKHFSGYASSSGKSCNPATEECADNGSPP